MDCQRFETLLSDAQSGRLAAPAAEAVAEHRRSCARCAALSEEVMRLKQELAGFPQLPVRRELVEAILRATSGIRERSSLWHDIIRPTLIPFYSQRFAFATLMMFVFISVMVNVLGPEFSAYSRNPSLLIEKADQVSSSIYGGWRRFNDFKAQVAEEIGLLRDDLLGRLDYHLITLLFREYEAAQSPATPDADSGPDRQDSDTDREGEDTRNE